MLNLTARTQSNPILRSQDLNPLLKRFGKQSFRLVIIILYVRIRFAVLHPGESFTLVTDLDCVDGRRYCHAPCYGPIA